MRKLKFTIVALAVLAWIPPALAVVGETTVKVADGAAPIPQATITITFKDKAGKPLRTVKRPALRTGPKAGTRTVKIPDNTTTADITVTTATGRTQTRNGLDVALLTGREIVIDVPGGAPLQIAGPAPRTGPPAESFPAVVYPGAGGLPVAFGSSSTQIPQVSGGTRFTPTGGETSIVDSRRRIPGVSAALGLDIPTPRDRVFWTGDYFTIAAGFNGFNDSVRGDVPVGTPSAFTYIFPNPTSNSTGLGPTATGQSVTLATKGQIWDLALGTTTRVPAGPIFASPTGSFWTYGFGVRYRHMNIEHNITQQSLTFPDLNVAIDLDLQSHFIGPNFTVGFEAMQPLPSGVFGGASAFVSPGALITDASARQQSRCGPCGVASPEFDLVLQRNFSDTTFAVMTGVNGFIGYRFNPNFRIQGEASYQYLSHLKSLAVPTSPVRQPIGLTSNSSDVFSVGGRVVFDFLPPQGLMQAAR
ncbi:hypothetical protein [Bradyrhizobium sp.]|uniref:hypothetical protein n=1 Tax=Bradyrhizobium sp. TaxID=376 RepID=UPI0027329274|nr:hypothetical protein [Bradyrhizobium sp.]MDP3692543.1 hypothetical protein [Bradyrhizobium sp.]